jgi:hypothetical protein
VSESAAQGAAPRHANLAFSGVYKTARLVLHVLLPVLQQAIDQSGEPVGHRGNGFGSAEPGAQSTVLGSEIAGAAE